MTKLKEVRLAKGLSQSKLAEASGVSLRAIQSYEQGWRDIGNVPKVVVRALADVLGVEPEEILKKAGE